MANKNVIVLAPNGRRQNVAVTPNTTILQVIEEVCQKHGYNANDYDLKHFNKVQDPNAILRFTGLANNAQLEMVPCTKIRSVSTVVIGVQLENGERLMGEFVPSVTLDEVLQNVKVDEDFEKVTLTYMHREISGIEALKNTTLKSLGLNSGKAVLRLIHKSSQNAHPIITATALKPTKTKTNEAVNKTKRNSGNECSLVADSNKKPNSVMSLKMKAEKSKESKMCSSKNAQQEPKEEQEEKIETVPSTSTESCIEAPISVQPCKKYEADILKDIQFLGERNALIFNQAAIQGTARDELPDEFYDLTVDDAKVLLRDAKRYRQELEEAPLLTNVQRQLDQEKRTQEQLKKYHHTIIRIQFPDQFVLQGLFQPMETVQAIKDFIKSYMDDANSDFVVFTTPPKHILDPNAQLVNENLVPCAIVHYSGPSSLKLDIKQKFIDPKTAALQVARLRMLMKNQESQSKHEDAKTSGATNSKSASAKHTNDESLNGKRSKTPKWLSSSFK